MTTVELRAAPAAQTEPGAVRADVGHAATITADDASLPAATEGLFAETWGAGGRYALVSELARGGGGKIAVAIDRKLGRKVALKRPLDAHGDSRLEREALVLARLEHPAIVPIHDAGHDPEGSPFYTMKLLGGQNLARRIDDAKTFEARLALLPAITTVADAIAYAHSQHVIHRDLKPGNVLVGEFGEVAVIDWGLGKVLGTDEPAPRTTPMPGPRLTVDGAIMGTPAYMAPEQGSSATVDERADVYAIGAMLYEAMTGTVPYGDLSSAATLARLVEGPPLPIDEREPRVPRDLAAIVEKAMAREPGARYPTARELADDLRRYQTGRLVAAHRYAIRTRVWKWLRRHQARVAIGAGTLAVVAASIVMMQSRPVDQTCEGLDAHVVAAWNPQVRRQIETAFAASHLAYAPALLRRVTDALDRHARAITTTRIDACRAARITKEQSEPLLAKRMQCLDRRTAELASLTEALAHADAKSVATSENTVAAVLGLVEDCSDLRRLDDLAPLPGDPVLRAEVLAIENEMSHVAVLSGQDRRAEWIALVPALVARATVAGFGPTLGRARLWQARALIWNGKTDDAERQLRSAIELADRAHDERDRQLCMFELIRLELRHRGRPDIAQLLVDLVAGSVESGSAPQLRDNVLVFRSEIANDLRDTKQAVAYAEQALAVAKQHDPDNAYSSHRVLAEMYLADGRIDDAERELHAVIAEQRAHYGTDDTPDHASAIGDLATAAFLRGDAAKAIELEEQEVAIDAKLRETNANNWLTARNNLGAMRHSAVQNEESERELEAALADADHLLGPRAEIGVEIAYNLGIAREGLGHYEAAAEAYRDSIRRAELVDPAGPAIVKARGELGSVYTILGRDREAVELLQPALAYHVQRRNPDSAEAAQIRADLGHSQVGLGLFESGRNELLRALPILDHALDSYGKAYYRIALAKAQWQLGEHKGALATAADARRWIKDTDSAADLTAELAAWERSR
jgi:tetratricopeptide (TPR) repeat protein